MGIQYTNKDLMYVRRTKIVEWDMKDAGMSVIRSFNLLPSETIHRLEKLPKKERAVSVGKIRRDDKDFSKAFDIGMKDVMNAFIDENDIDRGRILSVKNDAVFIVDVVPTYVGFWEVDFIAKNRYSSYILLDGNKEFYYGEDRVDAKGFGQEIIDHHKDYMISLIGGLLRTAENIKAKEMVAEFMMTQDQYLGMELQMGYYREMNTDMCFRLKNEEGMRSYGIRDEFEDMIDCIDVSHNYRYLLGMFELML